MAVLLLLSGCETTDTSPYDRSCDLECEGCEKVVMRCRGQGEGSKLSVPKLPTNIN